MRAGLEARVDEGVDRVYGLSEGKIEAVVEGKVNDVTI
jgi:hypothetical protein